ncbi:Brix domain-containing protein [Melampsora americana]|nr:Brix domain-containing protein [Melampsora americana]
MQRTVKPKNARSKRALQAREPKLIEDSKTSIFIKSTQTSEKVRIALSELHQLRSSSNSIQFSKRNVIHPFEDSSSLQFWSIKNDANLFVIGSDSKKRPDNLTFIRMFDHQVLDMIELGIEGAVSLKEMKGPKASPGLVPLLHFAGTLWDTDERLKMLKSMFLDFFHGHQLKSIDLVNGLQYVISISIAQIDQEGSSTSLLNHNTTIPTPNSNQEPSQPAPVSIVHPDRQAILNNNPLPLIHFRTHLVQLLKSGQREPRVELSPHGPSFDFRLRRTQMPSEELLKLALKRQVIKKPADKVTKVKGNKNIDIDEMGDKVGKIHVGKQSLDKLQSRKMKGLKLDKRTNVEKGDSDESGSEKELTKEDKELEMGAVTELGGSGVSIKRTRS